MGVQAGDGGLVAGLEQPFVALGEAAGVEVLLVTLLLHPLGVEQRSLQMLVFDHCPLVNETTFAERAGRQLVAVVYRLLNGWLTTRLCQP